MSESRSSPSGRGERTALFCPAQAVKRRPTTKGKNLLTGRSARAASSEDSAQRLQETAVVCLGPDGDTKVAWKSVGQKGTHDHAFEEESLIDRFGLSPFAYIDQHEIALRRQHRQP